MWRSLWRSIDRFSLPYFKYIINELQGIKVVNTFNREAVIDILQSIVEIVTYGDRHDPSIFECFMEYQVLAQFVRLLKISKNSRIEASLLQYLSIMIQNLQSEQAIYYCFSNEYINSIITHQYDFDGGDLALYYVSFLRAVSGKLNRDTLCLLVKVQEDIVTSFPLYSEALRFAYHREKMIQTAIRSLTLSVYNVSDDMVYQFVTTPPVSKYFSDLVLSLREQCLLLDATVCAMEGNCSADRGKELISAIEKFLDDLYYVKDLLCVGESRLSSLVTQKVLGLLVVPIMVPFIQLNQDIGIRVSPVTSIYILSCLLQVVDRKEVVNSVASLVLYPHVARSVGGVAELDSIVCIIQADSSSDLVNKMEQILSSSLKSNEADGELSGYSLESNPSDCNVCSNDRHTALIERNGIISYFFSDNQGLLLASLMLLLVLAESKDLDLLLSSVIGFPQTKDKTGDASVSKVLEESIFVRYLPQIMNALLKILGSTSTSSVLTQWHAGWFLQKFIISERATLSHHELNLFNASFHQSREHFVNELGGCLFDFIPDTFKKEWASCRKVMEDSSQTKDPFFILEIAFHKNSSDGNNFDAWQRMVDAVKVFVLHLQLKACMLQAHLPDDLQINWRSNSMTSPRTSHASDASSASFGSEVPLGSGIPCKIAFSEVGVRDVYMIPVAKEISGKLLLVEKHPFHSRRGIVLAIAPLAGLSPKVEESHPTWLHLRIREFNPKHLDKRGHQNANNHEADGRWTLGFPDADACEAARLLIAQETCKQRSFVESLLAPFLHDNYLGSIADSQVN
ncbi:hypothetical protein Nepgr_011830 [Nepenthes gracilis]|uniref:FPL domain-containing protein n=1 Tax=Nepenthes gracilis TaxID=150966 RepID=A0AAD3XMM3_NEPGR|nr:hypothetical protein Nepgr_011830 [Nepenthes gracilis]